MKFTQKLYCLSVLTLLLCFALPQEVSGQAPKIGVVNFKQCVERSKVGKKEQENFESLKQQMEQRLEKKEKTLNETANKLNDPDYLDTLSTDKEAELKHQFRMENQELGQYQQQYYQMLNQANFRIIQQLTETINQASKKVAAEQGLDVILNEEGSFYYSPKLDVTSNVIEVMDKNFQDDAAK
ncbi:MAG: OmpH family outer membrane protein [Waddliaceae bacterium]